MYRDQDNPGPADGSRRGRDGARAYTFTHDFDGSAELTTTLAHAISDVTGVDVTDTAFTLSDHVDPEALDRLFKPSSEGTSQIDGQFSFIVWEYRVTVYSDGQITIVPPQQPPESGQRQDPRR